MPNILEFLAHTHQSWIHPRGRAATRCLLDKLAAETHDKVLEIGFGTGQTLVEAAGRWPGARFWAIERSAAMFEAASRRLRFCGIGQAELLLTGDQPTLPFPDGFFDAVYAESVLAILPDAAIEGCFREIHRVLRPGGVFLNNESLWLSGLPAVKRQEINRMGVENFGIQQAAERWATKEGWLHLAETSGLVVADVLPLSAIRPLSRWSLQPPWRSTVFSALGWVRRTFHPALRAQRRSLLAAQKEMSRQGPFLEAWLFHFTRPASCTSHGQVLSTAGFHKPL